MTKFLDMIHHPNSKLEPTHWKLQSVTILAGQTPPNKRINEWTVLKTMTMFKKRACIKMATWKLQQVKKQDMTMSLTKYKGFSAFV
jgi:hypothetical protein